MALQTQSLARMQKGIDNLTEFGCSHLSGCKFYSGMGTGILPEPYKSSFNHGCLEGVIDYVIYSYATPIAWHYTNDYVGPQSEYIALGWCMPDTSYSVTTTQHQNAVRTAIRNSGFYEQLHSHVMGTGVQ